MNLRDQLNLSQKIKIQINIRGSGVIEIGKRKFHMKENKKHWNISMNKPMRIIKS